MQLVCTRREGESQGRHVVAKFRNLQVFATAHSILLSSKLPEGKHCMSLISATVQTTVAANQADASEYIRPVAL
jgi:hypothetical protein